MALAVTYIGQYNRTRLWNSFIAIWLVKHLKCNLYIDKLIYTVKGPHDLKCYHLECNYIIGYPGDVSVTKQDTTRLPWISFTDFINVDFLWVCHKVWFSQGSDNTLIIQALKMYFI